jgi:hypothetical protein
VGPPGRLSLTTCGGCRVPSDVAGINGGERRSPAAQYARHHLSRRAPAQPRSGVNRTWWAGRSDANDRTTKTQTGPRSFIVPHLHQSQRRGPESRMGIHSDQTCRSRRRVMARRSPSARPALGSVFMMSKVEVVVRRVAVSESTDQCEDEEGDSHHHLTWAAEPVARLACLHREDDGHRAPTLPNVQRRPVPYRVACSGARCTISMRAPHGSVI